VIDVKEGADNALAALEGFSYMSRKLKVQRSDPNRSRSSIGFSILAIPRSFFCRNPELNQSQNHQPPAFRRTIAVAGLPDTVNETRLRKLIPHHLSLEKIEMKPQNEGAIFTFEKEADAAQASMVLEGVEISGRVLRVVSVRDLKRHQPQQANPEPPAVTVPSSRRFGVKKRMVPRT